MILKPEERQRFISVLFLLLLGLVVMGVQHSFLGMYYDDYGNASLSYGYVVEGVEGTNYTFSDLLTWAKYCYLNWGGRVLYAVLFVIPLLKNGITAYMAVQTVVLMGICFVSSRIICHYTNKKYDLLSITLLYILFGLIKRGHHVHGTYWASASVLYVWPLLPLFLACFVYIKACEKIKNNHKLNYGWLLPLLIVLLFFAACSQEQVGLSMIVFLLFYIGFDHIKDWKQYLLLDAAALVSAVFGYLLLFLAPGNFVRLNSNSEFAELGFFEKLANSFPKVLGLLFMNSFNPFNMLLLLGTFFMTIRLAKKHKKWRIAIGTTIVLSVIYVGLNNDGMNFSEFAKSGFYVAFLIHFLAISIVYFYDTKRPQLNAFTITAGASVFCLLYSPSIYERCSIEYLYIVFILLGILFIDGWEYYSNRSLYKVTAAIFLVWMGILSFLNFSKVFNGYRENSFYLKYNDKTLRQYNEADGNVIFLAELPNPSYRGEMSYDENRGFIDEWYKEYYNIPKNVSIQWGQLEVNKTLQLEGQFYEDGWFGKTATITVRSQTIRSLIFEYYFSEEMFVENGLVISIDGDETVLMMKPGSHRVEFTFPEQTKEVVEIQLTALATFVPAQKGTSTDTRELSMMLKIRQ